MAPPTLPPEIWDMIYTAEERNNEHDRDSEQVPEEASIKPEEESTEPVEQYIQPQAKRSKESKYILDTDSVFALRLGCRGFYSESEYAFTRRFFASMKFSLTPWSLKLLQEISQHKQLKHVVQHLEFGPDRLNTQLAKKFRKGPNINWKTVWPSWKFGVYQFLTMYPDWLDEAQYYSIQWTDATAYKSWKLAYENTFVAMKKEQKRMEHEHHDIRILTDVFKRLPKLKSVMIEPRPAVVGTRLFDTTIRPCKGTRRMVENVGIDDMNTYIIYKPHQGKKRNLQRSEKEPFIITEPGQELRLFQPILQAVHNSRRTDLAIDVTMLPVISQYSQGLYQESGTSHPDVPFFLSRGRRLSAGQQIRHVHFASSEYLTWATGVVGVHLPPHMLQALHEMAPNMSSIQMSGFTTDRHLYTGFSADMFQLQAPGANHGVLPTLSNLKTLLVEDCKMNGAFLEYITLQGKSLTSVRLSDVWISSSRFTASFRPTSWSVVMDALKQVPSLEYLHIVDAKVDLDNEKPEQKNAMDRAEEVRKMAATSAITRRVEAKGKHAVALKLELIGGKDESLPDGSEGSIGDQFDVFFPV